MELDNSPDKQLKNNAIDHQTGHGNFWTVTRKLTLMTVVLTSIGFFIFIAFTANSMRSNLDRMATDSYTAMAGLLADSVTGAVRWNKASQVEPTFNKTSKGGESPLIALNVYGLPDNPKAIEAEYNIDGKINEALAERLMAAKAVRSEDTVVDSADGSLIITVPVKHEKNQNIIGHLVSVWDTTSIESTVWQKTQELYLLGGFSVLLLAMVLSVVINRGIGRRIARSVNIANEIAKGNLNNSTEVKSQDELGQLDHALNEVQISLRAGDDSERRAAEFGRIKQALDCATASTMLADENHTIVYTNDACDRLIADIAPTLKINSPNQTQIKNLIGQSLNLFSKFQGFTESEIVQIVQNTKLEISEGELSLQISITPVTDASGNRLGTVVEWLDRSTEVNAELEVQAMVDAASEGDFSRRIDSTGMRGFYAQIAIMLNKLVEISEVGMNDILKVLRALASGQLDERIESDLKGVFAELRESSNATSDKLTDIVSQIREAAAAVNQGANEMSGGNQDLSNRTEQQAAHLQETAAAMSEMSETVRNNSDSANKANELANQAKEEAERGGQVTARAVVAVNEISEASRKISDIIGVIDNIAFQTNLLALNASVEAARAGDKGRGFAVVASEVRDLAGRSATAAKEIKDLIDDSVSKVDEGERLVGESGEALNAIVNSVNKVSNIVSDIASAGFEQTDGINQINIAISRIDEMTQRNAALVEQAASTSQKVGNEANHLDELVKFFNTSPNKITPALRSAQTTGSLGSDTKLKLAS